MEERNHNKPNPRHESWHFFDAITRSAKVRAGLLAPLVLCSCCFSKSPGFFDLGTMGSSGAATGTGTAPEPGDDTPDRQDIRKNASCFNLSLGLAAKAWRSDDESESRAIDQ